MKKILILLLIPFFISSSDLDNKYQKQKIKNEKAARKQAQKALKAAQKPETFGVLQRQIREVHQGVGADLVIAGGETTKIIQQGEVSSNSVIKQTAESGGELYQVFTRENMALLKDLTVTGVKLIKVTEGAVGNTIALTAANVEVASYGLTHGSIMGVGDAVGTQVTTAGTFISAQAAATATALAPYAPVIAGVAITGGIAYGGYEVYRHINPTEAMKLEAQKKLDAMKANIAKSKEQIALSEANIVSFHAQAESFKKQAKAIKLQSRPIEIQLEINETEDEFRHCLTKNFCSKKLNSEGFADECDSHVRKLRALTLNPNAGSGLINIFKQSYPQQ